jgi:chromosome segregation ATPase
MLGLTTTRRLRTEVAAEKAETGRQRERAEKALAEAATARYNRDQIVRQHADLDAANRRLMGRNLELGRRLSSLTESDPEYAARLERRVSRLLAVAGRLFLAHREQEARADHLQQRLDDVFGLNTSPVTKGATWQDRRETRMKYDKPTAEEATP